MENLRAWSHPVALVTAWMLAAAYVLTALATQPPMPTFRAQEVVIKVGAPGQAS